MQGLYLVSNESDQEIRRQGISLLIRAVEILLTKCAQNKYPSAYASLAQHSWNKINRQLCFTINAFRENAYKAQSADIAKFCAILVGAIHTNSKALISHCEAGSTTYLNKMRSQTDQEDERVFDIRAFLVSATVQSVYDGIRESVCLAIVTAMNRLMHSLHQEENGIKDISLTLSIEETIAHYVVLLDAILPDPVPGREDNPMGSSASLQPTIQTRWLSSKSLYEYLQFIKMTHSSQYMSLVFNHI